jgi:hypothetical protein
MNKKPSKPIVKPVITKKNVNKTSEVKESGAYFVSIKSPLELRRQLLEAAKKAVYALQNYERIILIRERKLKEMAELKVSIKELQYLNKKFNEKLPKYYHDLLPDPKKITRETESAFAVQEPAQRKEKPVKKLQRDKTELEKLEDSLNSIEGKIKRLNVQ